MPNIKLETTTMVAHLDERMDYADTTKAMRLLLAEAVQLTHTQAMQFTWHSMKVSVVNEGLQQGEEPMTVGLQGHWKDPNGPMPTKYTRAGGWTSPSLWRDASMASNGGSFKQVFCTAFPQSKL
jgi:hypothetical protein